MAGFDLNFGQQYGNQVMGVQPMQQFPMSSIGSAPLSMGGKLDSLFGLESNPFSKLMNGASGSTGQGGVFNLASMFGGEGSTGWVNPMLQGIGGILGGWNGMQQLDLAKDQFAFTKEAYQTNLANQTQLTNQQLMDRQTRRNIERPDLFNNPDSQWQKQNLLPSNN